MRLCKLMDPNFVWLWGRQRNFLFLSFPFDWCEIILTSEKTLSWTWIVCMINLVFDWKYNSNHFWSNFVDSEAREKAQSSPRTSKKSTTKNKKSRKKIFHSFSIDCENEQIQRFIACALLIECQVSWHFLLKGLPDFLLEWAYRLPANDGNQPYEFHIDARQHLTLAKIWECKRSQLIFIFVFNILIGRVVIPWQRAPNWNENERNSNFFLSVFIHSVLVTFFIRAMLNERDYSHAK